MGLPTVALIGAVDAGKSALAVSLLHGAVTYDRFTRGGVVRSRDRTITVRDKLARARSVLLIDTPGYDPFLRIACVALTMADHAVWVVDGEISVRPHGVTLLRAARALGVDVVIPFVPHPSADPELRRMVEDDIRAHVGEAPILASDPAAVEAALATLPVRPRDVDGPLELPVQRVYSRRGSWDGVVVGRITRGTLRAGDEVELIGLTKKNGILRVAELQVFGAKVDEARAGDLVAARFTDVFAYAGWMPFRDDRVIAERGKALVTPGSATPTRHFACDVDLLAAADGGRSRPFTSGFAPQFLLGTADVTGTCELPEGTRADPGSRVRMDVTLHEPALVHPGMPFLVLGQTSVARGLIATGRIG